MPPYPDHAPTFETPAFPVLALGRRDATWLTPDGEIETLTISALKARLGHEAPLLVHRPAIGRRLGLAELDGYDLLELFAFVRPSRFCLPTPGGIADALGLAKPKDPEEQTLILAEAVPILLEELGTQRPGSLIDLARLMAAAGWNWGRAVLAALGAEPLTGRPRGLAGIDIWSRMPEWSEAAPPEPPSHYPVEPDEARRRLAELIQGGGAAEARPQQADYASAVSAAFAPRDTPDSPTLVLAEAGTGVGKTLGYLAPASVWAERNGAAVWVSTYTRNLQAQIEQELDRLFPDPRIKAERVVVRKGRENYLCLLNFEDAARAAIGRLPDSYAAPMIALGLMARWAEASRDGALIGGDFPGWLVDLLGRAQTLGLADRRGECVYSACPHYQKCFIEHSIRKARRADIVIANHALVMVQAALGGLDDAYMPSRYVFDEGHHVFEAADSAFSAHLSGQATSDLRRWILGVESRTSRARGLRRRLEDLLYGDDQALEALQDTLVAAAALPAEGWAGRLAEDQPRLAIEKFLATVRRQVLARTPGKDSAFDIETERQPAIEGMAEAAAGADAALKALQEPMALLAKRLEKKLDEEAAELDTPLRLRIEAMARSLDRRVKSQVAVWRGMLADLERAMPDGVMDWLSITREFGREVDVGLHRHWIDPTQPFAEAVMKPAHGVLVTSATLTDGTGDIVRDWEAAEARTGAAHILQAPIRASVPSPFDYKTQTLSLIVTDIRRDDLDQMASAYRELFLASAGGGLGLFTAISRLKAVHERIAGHLDGAGIPLLAQHQDGMDVGTLIDIFRAEEDTCLLGTDAVRDGVDVPGRSLRLIVFDRVPWPRPDILHKARKARFGGKNYDDMLTRLKLRQAFGRLIRRAEDRGVFVLLDAMMPTRLFGAFPEGAEPRRVGLAEAVELTRAFFENDKHLAATP
jgi:ATP-dependent DNA helicase DinG